MLKQRVITALVLLLVAVPVTVFLPVWAFGLMTLLFVIAGLWEWLRLIQCPRRHHAYYLLSLLLFGGALLLSPGLIKLLAQGLWMLSILFWLVVVTWLLPKGAQMRVSGAQWAVIGMLVLLSAWLALYVLLLNDRLLMLSTLFVVWAADIGAYFVGKACGRHKLAPNISPGKTWEGAVGGWLSALIISTLLLKQKNSLSLALILNERFNQSGMLFALSLLVMFSVFGDLFESQLKRMAGVKDSSQLLPGHGGVLDRIDALLPVLPIAALLVT